MSGRGKPRAKRIREAPSHSKNSSPPPKKSSRGKRAKTATALPAIEPPSPQRHTSSSPSSSTLGANSSGAIATLLQRNEELFANFTTRMTNLFSNFLQPTPNQSLPSRDAPGLVPVSPYVEAVSQPLQSSPHQSSSARDASGETVLVQPGHAAPQLLPSTPDQSLPNGSAPGLFDISPAEQVEGSLPREPPNAGPSQGGMTSNPNVVIEAIQVGHHLKADLKNSIINNNFIADLRSLLPTKNNIPVENSSVAVGIFTISTKLPNRSAIQIGEWYQAWNILQAIYCSAWSSTIPDITSRLAKHCEVVLALHDKNQDWRYYDASFRKLLEAGKIQWGQLHLELQMEAKFRGMGSPAPQVPIKLNMPSPSSVPQGFCFAFHKQGRCPNRAVCQFNHSCYACGKPHSRSNCLNNTANAFRPSFRGSQGVFTFGAGAQGAQFPNRAWHNASNRKGRGTIKRLTNPY